MLLPSTPNGGASMTFGHRKIVVGGDKLGRVVLWDWEAEYEGEAGGEGRVVEPRRTIRGEGTGGGKVTALEINEAVVLVGSLDGTLRLYCPLTSHLLRTFRDRTAPRHPSRLLAQNLIPVNEEDRWRVGTICAKARGEVVACVGDRVLSWRVEGEKVGKGKAKGKGVQRLSARSERFRSDFDLRQQVLESLDSLTSEQTSRLSRLGHEQHLITSYGLPPSLENMTEEEAVALALMLSREEESGSGSGRSSARQSPEWEPVPEELLLEMDGLSLDSDGRGSAQEGRSFGNQRGGSTHAFDEEGDYHPSPSTSASRSLSLSVPTSPTLRGSSLGPSSSHGTPSPRSSSYTWRPSPSPSSFAGTTYEPHSYASSGGSPSNMKVQLSPRLGPTYGTAGALGQREEVPDMSEELWPMAGASNSVSTSPAPAGSSSARRVEPSPSSSPSPAALSSASTPAVASPSPAPSTPARRGWSDVARSTPSSASPSPSPAPSSPWASSSTSPIPRSSLLSDQLRRTERESREEELRRREEEEIKFVMELSAAEERSRREV
ncbi:hypothetical protein BCR35DRAFT_305735 [Leucosporidium creatinivorum]|uniref:WD40-repeat-containing domain protein n=1 Tax=Leucosporidium creatinivorum TaxID=106004 RepID=A0A1Y2EYE8_9BASI|nr:hypothetical protein BCR35DRAFT_305735 [Leucosporidium creatinivorum]